MHTEDRMEEDYLTDVTLVCMFCGERCTIHVFRDRHLPETIYWKCIDCQKVIGDSSTSDRKTGGRKGGVS
jgi:hypothetical protein